MKLLTLQISDEDRSRWGAEAKRLGMSVAALVRAAVDERIAAEREDPSTLDTHGIDGAHISVAHGNDIVTVVTIRGSDASVWAGAPTAARALAAMLLYQARAADLDGRTCP